jgi:hypothetical protein
MGLRSGLHAEFFIDCDQCIGYTINREKFLLT